ncbi:MAG: cell division protein FtsQ/DivIB [Bacteroidota bacterium]
MFILFWVGVALGMAFVLRLAWKRQEQAICKGYRITRPDEDTFVFVTRSDIEQLIRLRAGGRIVGQQIDRFPLQGIEDTLKTYRGVSGAQAYFDNGNNLQIRIQERIPIARVFATNDSSFYLDSTGLVLPLSETVVIDCPVFNGMKWMNGRPDSIQSRRIVTLARYIQADSFWTAQVGQFDIDEKGLFEMIPTAGNHRVQFGTADDPENAFRRLWLFYQQVLRVQGLDRYARIDVRYKGQVVASRNRFATTSDTTQVRKRVEMLLDAGLTADTTLQSVKPIKRAT